MFQNQHYRDRNADGMEEKILALYACGMSQRDISEQIKNLNVVEISDGLVSKIVDKISPEVTAWQNRPLESVYPFIFRDACHYKVQENHQYVIKAVFVSVVNPMLISDFSGNTLRKPKADKKDAVKLALYTLTYWLDLTQYQPQKTCAEL